MNQNLLLSCFDRDLGSVASIFGNFGSLKLSEERLHPIHLNLTTKPNVKHVSTCKWQRVAKGMAAN